MNRLNSMILHVLILGGLAIFIAQAPAMAQSKEILVLIERVSKLERDLIDVQRNVYRPSEELSSSTNLGAPPPELENLIRRQETMRFDLEARIAHLTGLIEHLDYGLKQAASRLDKLIEDVDYRLVELERGSTLGTDTALAVEDTSMGGAVSEVSTQIQNDPPDDGSLENQTLRIVMVPDQPGMLPEGTPEEQYEFAFSFLRQLDFERAEAAFKEFLAAHPSHELTGNGQYWLGETYYVRNVYADAAVAFLEGYQKSPSGRKAPANLLKLGLSLSQLGQKDEACSAFGQLLEQFPDAHTKVRDRAASERSLADCP